MNFVFSGIELPCNEKEDFNTTNTSLDIVCRIYLSEAPDKEHERIAEELDGENYNPSCFFIEAVAGRNEPDEDIVTSGWSLGYVTEDNGIHDFGYIADDIHGAWEYFKEELMNY